MVSPQLAEAIAIDAKNREAAGVTLDRLDVAAARASLPDLGLALPAGLTIAPVEAANTPAYWLTPQGCDNGPRIVYLHGGGFVAGDINSHRTLAAWLAQEARGPLLFVEYTRAPERKYPSQIEQAYGALYWAHENGPNGKSKSNRVVVGGDSAGANIAVAAMLLARQRGGAGMPRAGLVLCGMVDIDESSSPFAGSSQRVREMIQAYVRSERDIRDPLACPARADLSDLPPLLIQTGTADSCRPDCEAFAARAKAAGVDATLTVYQEMFHVWQRFAPMLPEASQALSEAGAFVTKHAQA